MTAGNDLLALYGTWRLHVKHGHEATAQLLDNLIQRSQELADVYVRFADQVPSPPASKPADVQAADEVVHHAAKVWLAHRLALEAVIRALGLLDDGESINDRGWDF